MRCGAVVGSSVLLSPLRGTKTERNGSRVAVVGTRNVDDLNKKERQQEMFVESKKSNLIWQRVCRE